MKTIRLQILVVLTLFGAGTLQAGNMPGRSGMGPRPGVAASGECPADDCPQAGNRGGKGKADGKGNGQRTRRRDGSGNGNGKGRGNGPGDGTCRRGV